MRTRVALATLLLFLLLATTAQAQEYDELLKRLEGAEASPSAGTIVLEAVREAPRISEARRVYSLYGDLVDTDEQRLKLYRELAFLEELAGNYQGALVYYERVLEIDPQDEGVRLGAAAAALETGAFERSRRHSRYVIDSARHGASQRRAALYLALSYYHLDERSEGLPLFRSLTGGESRGTVESATLALALLAARSWSASEYAEELEEKLRRLYPESLDRLALTAESAVSLSPRPSLLLPGPPWERVPTSEAAEEEVLETTAEADGRAQAGAPTTADRSADPAKESVALSDEEAEPRVIGIQTGSFSDQANASVMRDEILEEGITAELREIELDGRRYYRVVVPTEGPVPPEAAQELVVRLKELGVEGFLLFQE